MTMKDEQLLAILRLQATKNIGDITAKKLISACGSPEQIFKESLSNLLKIQGISNYAVQHIFDRKTYKKAEEELLFLKRSNYNYHYFFNDDYPYNLKHCFDAPILIFTDGNISLNTKRI
ncbi:MAG TPA: DNA-protecting protein DprA, partial [Tenacibaculum sp.]|nr:DNA-protecting protein DprA [Tenacibaculum sp.]